MNNDLISRAATIAAIERREPLLVGDGRVSTAAFKGFLRKRPAVDAVTVVRCKDCTRRGFALSCPMCYDEYTWDEDEGSDCYTVDNTVDDGFCYLGTDVESEGVANE